MLQLHFSGGETTTKKCVSTSQSHLCGVASFVGDPIPDKTLKKKSAKISLKKTVGAGMTNYKLTSYIQDHCHYHALFLKESSLFLTTTVYIIFPKCKQVNDVKFYMSIMI